MGRTALPVSSFPANAPLRWQAGPSIDEQGPRLRAQIAGVLADLAADPDDQMMQLGEEAERLRRALRRAWTRIRELEHLVETDTLTPLANRRGILRDIERAQAQVERHGIDAALLYLDVDGLKAINDRHGHGFGDAALLHVAHTLRGRLRATDSIGRIGGDEFLVLLLHADAALAEQKAQLLADAIAAEPVRVGAIELVVRVSVGVRALTTGSSPDELVDFADRDMYSRKPCVAQG